MNRIIYVLCILSCVSMLTQAQGLMRRGGRVVSGISYTYTTDSVTSDALDGWGNYNTGGDEYWNEGAAGTKNVGYWGGQENMGWIFYLGIPQGSTIDSAIIHYHISTNSFNAADSIIYKCYDVDSVNAFHDDGSHVLSAHATNGSLSPAELVTTGTGEFTSMNIAAVVQEVTDRAGYDSDDPVGIFVEFDTSTNNRDHLVYDSKGAAYYPWIWVKYH